ncbi:hypothetical protein CKO44_15225 [Rubrivivax gelatinosus]|uniref:Fatty acid hydroxylase domain-containing protein n=1 Tax=Rubrivivax gelatinosus TaxID=28068 RepID=A0ABS1DWX2_RUBGE|nr:sterol desaturase family protein [Rubrivivax gelatinosus]MBK1614820.1 hypothetical protein [Rubrivivax gelatinosus]MBK1713611.1 hypothetical protein [Rubrivivax gelatinosus]
MRADFAFYGLLVLGLAAVVPALTPPGGGAQALLWTAAGAGAWTLAEYGLHRFVLHGLPPFRRWHALHHERPCALIGTPTVLTAALFLVAVFLPVAWLAPTWRGLALSWGVMLGYLVYIGVHHAVHHAPAATPWLRRQRHWHALHHRAGKPACYGVSVRLWDHVFGSTGGGSGR